jgi:hypothetical protein
MCHYQHAQKGREYWDPVASVIREVERICRIETQWQGDGKEYSDRTAGLQYLRADLYADEEKFLAAVDLRLSHVSNPAVIEELEVILKDAGSEWRVGQFKARPALVKRVDDTVQHAAEVLAKLGTRPGKLLGEAWGYAFSMHTNPSSAYRSAVRAVEAAAAPVLTPKDPQPSLGKMITALRDGMAKWRFAFTVDSKVDPKKVLVDMMQLLWTNDYARHIDVDPAAPLNVSQEEAETAVVLALTLINWFTSGAIEKI